MKKIHLDTDLAGDTDDLCALAMLLRWPNVEITGITTAAEDKGRRAGYTKYALKLARREEIPVAAGADFSLGGYHVTPGYPPHEEMWPESVPPAPNPLRNALKLLKKSIEQNATIIAVGPYTNLALLDKEYPGILKEVKLHLMGGYIYHPRKGFPKWGVNMDYNVQQDTTAAKLLIENYHPTLVPLTVTIETALRKAYLSRLRKSGALGRLLARQAEVHARQFNMEKEIGKKCEGLPNDILNFQHDPLTCAVALGWDGVEIQEVPLKLEIKETWLHEHIDQSGVPTKVVTKIDANRFNKLWIDIVARDSQN